MFIPGVHSQPTQHDLHITELISQQSQIICINMSETYTLAVAVTAPDTPSAMSFISLMLREKSRGISWGRNTDSKGVTRGYKDGLQPETLAVGNWLVKQNQPVSKLIMEEEHR